MAPSVPRVRSHRPWRSPSRPPSATPGWYLGDDSSDVQLDLVLRGTCNLYVYGKVRYPWRVLTSPAEGRPRMLRIQEVAAETGLTARAIRYYEEIGLLQPAAR